MIVTEFKENKEINYDDLTPMLRQYFDTKAQNPDCLLLFRVGDFYETYGNDAQIAAHDMEIVLTSKDAGKGQKVHMAGVPHHALDQYLKILLKKGRKVAICDQVEDAKLSKGLVKREITKIVTSGTILDPDMLDSRTNNYLASIFTNNGITGIAFTDVSTGDFYSTNISSFNKTELQNVLNSWAPSELLITQMDDCLKNELSQKYVITETSEIKDEAEYIELIKKYFPEKKTLHQNLKSPSIFALGIILEYIKNTQKSDKVCYFNLNTFSTNDFMILDEVSCRNLELSRTLKDNEKKGSLLWAIDNTITSMGGRLLQKWLFNPLIDVDKIIERQDALELLIKNWEQTRNIRELLYKTYDIERILTKIIYQTANARDLLALMESLKQIPIIKSRLPENSKALKDIYHNLEEMPEVFSLIENSIKDDPPLTIKEGNIIKEGYFKDLDIIRSKKANAKTDIAMLEEVEKQKTGIKSLKIKYNQVFGYYIEITKPNLHLVPDDYIRKQTVATGERFISQALKEYEDIIFGAQEKIQNIEYQLFIEIREKIAKEALGINKCAHNLAILDVISSLAFLAIHNNFNRPEVHNKRFISIKDARHPVVEKVIKSAFTPNDIYLDSEEQNLSIITGPNMSGKSTFLRQLALIVILAQMGSYIPASAASIGIVDRIFTRVGASDDLHLGQSTFMVEMQESANILNCATNRSLVILDEIGRGTSTFDGLSIAWAVAEYLHTKIKALTLFATHFHELTMLAGKFPGIKNYKVAVKESGDEVIFLHKIKPGGTDKSYGIYVAKLAGMPDKVLDRAGELLRKLEANKNMNQIPDLYFDLNYDKTECERTQKKEQQEEQLTLFDYDPDEQEIIDELKHASIADMTPLDAINKLYIWQQKLKK